MSDNAESNSPQLLEREVESYIARLQEQNAALQARVCELEQEVIRLANLKNRLLGEVIREDKTFTNA